MAWCYTGPLRATFEANPTFIADRVLRSAFCEEGCKDEPGVGVALERT